jgi:hypothetical protein
MKIAIAGIAKDTTLVFTHQADTSTEFVKLLNKLERSLKNQTHRGGTDS